jgi:hypothetical protein
MDQPRRYVFSGNASGLAFRIRRPVDVVLPVQAASSLPVTGGVSESKVGPGSLAKPGSNVDYIRFQSATTKAEGDYVDQRQAVDMTHQKVAFDSVPTYTNVSAEVTGLVVLGRLEIDRAVMAMQGQSAEHPSEPSIRCDGVDLEGVRVDGYPLKITLAEEFFCYNDTLSKLSAACGAGHDPQLFFQANRAAGYGFGNPYGMVKCTLVSEMAWEDKPHPAATIDGNALTIPDFGVVYFGESYITACSRRITMVRFQLGSPDGGEGSAAAGDGNGNPWPPTQP